MKQIATMDKKNVTNIHTLSLSLSLSLDGFKRTDRSLFLEQCCVLFHILLFLNWFYRYRNTATVAACVASNAKCACLTNKRE